MKKVMTVGFAALMAAGIAGAQDDMVMTGMPPADKAAPAVSAQVGLLNAYVWRGQVYNNDFVIQPQLTLSQYNFSFNVWGNKDLTQNYLGNNGQFSEIDLSLAYTLPIDVNEMSFDVGAINYNFPAGGDSTTELFASAIVQSWRDYVIPSVTLYADIEQVRGIYALFDVNVPYEISDYLSVNGGVSIGWGNNTYNDYYWPLNDQKAGINDYNLYANASYELTESLTASANLTYTMLEGGSIKDSAAVYESDSKLWGGVNIAYDF